MEGKLGQETENCTQEGAIDDVLAVLQDSIIEFN